MTSVVAKHPSISSEVKELRVLVVSNYPQMKQKLPFSGVYVERQVQSLREAGVAIETFDLGASHSPTHLFRKWLELRRSVRAFNPHIVHARYGTVTAALSVLSGRPTIVTFCGSDLNTGASVSELRSLTGRLLSNLAALKAERLICVSEGLRSAMWWRSGRAIVIPDGVDMDLFSPGRQDVARRELNWNPDARIVLFNLGDDAKKKGFDLAQAGIEAARARITGIELKIVQHVQPPQMPAYYRAADALLCTSLNEGSPNVVKEALACNLPVVSVPVGDVEQRLIGVKPSAVVPRDAEEIGKALADIFVSKQRCNGREHVTALALQEIAQRVIAEYRALLDGPNSQPTQSAGRAEGLAPEGSR
jgi:glycosyltransferase involved in cell wall biosynthesis